MDTSFFALESRKKFKAEEPQDKYTVNIHHFSHQFLDDLVNILQNEKPSQIDFVPAGIGRYDKDLEYASTVEQKIGKKIQINFWHQDFFQFLKRFGASKKVISARLHLFLIAKFIGLEASYFAYQTKLKKIDRVLQKLGFK